MAFAQTEKPDQDMNPYPGPKKRLVFSIIVLLVGIGVLMGSEEVFWGRAIAFLGLVSIVYNVWDLKRRPYNRNAD